VQPQAGQPPSDVGGGQEPPYTRRIPGLEVWHDDSGEHAVWGLVEHDAVATDTTGGRVTRRRPRRTGRYARRCPRRRASQPAGAPDARRTRRASLRLLRPPLPGDL